MSGPTVSNEQILATIRAAAARGLTLGAEVVRGDAVPRTPLEYGDLRSSLTVTPASADELAAAVSSDLPYAVRQHEDLSLRHDDGGPKYLENAVHDRAQDVVGLVAAEVRSALA